MEPRIPKRQLARARKMRRGQTNAEDLLWTSLRDRRLGVKFRRQVPIGSMVVDFACFETMVVVEVDGPSHETDEGRAQDARRDAVLRREGWRVVRLTNELVIGGGDISLDSICAVLKQTS